MLNQQIDAHSAYSKPRMCLQAKSFKKCLKGAHRRNFPHFGLKSMLNVETIVEN